MVPDVLPELRVRWLGTVPHPEASTLQRAIHATSHDYLLLQEHPHTYTLGRHGDRSHVLVDPSSVGATLLDVDRGGDVTYHGPGQLVGYPVVSVDRIQGRALADSPAFVASIEQVLIDTLARLGLAAGRLHGYPGVWVDADGPAPRKIAAIGVRIERGRSLHGFALNVAPDLAMFRHIVPCGLSGFGVTSLRAEGIVADTRTVVDTLVEQLHWGHRGIDRADVAWRVPRDDSDLSAFSRREADTDETTEVRGAPRADQGTGVRLLGRLADAGVAGGFGVSERKPEWMRAPVAHGTGVLTLRHTVRDLGLVTVCEEAGCPNLSECWADGTATFMVCGERCTRACGFCLVDTSKPDLLDASEPARVAEAVHRMDLQFAVITMVARDDLPDGGAAHVAATVEAIRARRPGTRVEALISDLRGDTAALETVLAVRPDVLNHNLETVARLQRAVRPSAGYARSLAVLAGASGAGLTVKSGLVVGMGETDEEIRAALRDLAAVGTSIVTIGQYLRPTARHLPVARWWTLDEFDEWRRYGEDELGLSHVESSPFTRSSYHARAAASR